LLTPNAQRLTRIERSAKGAPTETSGQAVLIAFNTHGREHTALLRTQPEAVMTVLMDSIQDHFAAEGRTPKGRRARRAIFAATRDLVVARGLELTSLEAIAHNAGLSQAALRHYYPTREKLFFAFFMSASHWFRQQVAALLRDRNVPAREQLERCISWHLEYMEHVDTAFWLEGSAYWIRHPQPRQSRDQFYRWLMNQYARLIGTMRPGLGRTEYSRRAYTLLTLVLGAWVTHGSGSALIGAGGVLEQRRLLLEMAMAIVTR
jgi:AcrR family transcriptional regulator